MEFHSGFDLARRDGVPARFQTLPSSSGRPNTRTVSPFTSTFKNNDSPRRVFMRSILVMTASSRSISRIGTLQVWDGLLSRLIPRSSSAGQDAAPAGLVEFEHFRNWDLQRTFTLCSTV